MRGHIIKNEDHSWTLDIETGVGARFDDLAELVRFAEKAGIPLSDSDHLLGYRIGGLVVELSECSKDRAAVLAALEETTDSVWKDAAREMAKLLTEWANAR